MTAALAEMAVRWENLKFYSNLILADPDVIHVPGAVGYSRSIMDLCNWGMSLTDSMVERAETMRHAMEKRKYFDSKLEQAKKITALIDSMKEDFSLREELLAAMHEETYDVRVDLNDALVQFCQAYFYETLEECGDAYKPSFGGDMTQLLMKINEASRASLLDDDIPSTLSRIIRITDTDTDLECNDATVCPINYFRKHRLLYFPLPTNHPELSDLHKYRVAEIQLEVTGAKSTTDNKWLQLRIESTGEFQGRAFGKEYNFLTKPLTNKAFEYNLETGHISIRADIYNPGSNIFSHITPYTTWLIYVYDPRSGDIDLSQVTQISMNLRGYGLIGKDTAENPNKPEQNINRPVRPYKQQDPRKQYKVTNVNDAFASKIQGAPKRRQNQ
jgi:hypothetical protein